MDIRKWAVGSAFALAIWASPSVCKADLLIAAGPDGGPYASSIGPNNDLVGQISVDGVLVPKPLNGHYGSTIRYTSDVTHLEFIYYGSEAGYHNEFQLNFEAGGWSIAEDSSGNQFKNNGGTDKPGSGNNGPLPRSTGQISVADLVEGDDFFRFNIVKRDGTQLGTVVNGNNPNDSDSDGDKNFFTAIWDDSVLLFLDDSGAGPDDNHDDMLIQIKAHGGSPSGGPEVVPEPTSLALFSLMGLGALGVSGRRRRRN